MFTGFGIMLSRAGAALLLATVSAHAATVTYSDVTSWLGATTGDTSISFTAPAGSFTSYNNSTGLVTSGVQFLGRLSPTAFDLTALDQADASPYYDFGAGAILRGPQFVNSTFFPYLHVILPANVTGFAANLATVSPNALTAQITLSDGESFNVVTGIRPSTTFFGLTADAPISYIDFAIPPAQNSSGTAVVLKNFQFGTASAGTAPPPAATPEAATFILIGTGLVFFRTLRKKLRPLSLQCA